MARRRAKLSRTRHFEIETLIGIAVLAPIAYFVVSRMIAGNPATQFNQNFPGAALNDPAMNDPFTMGQ